MEVGHLHARNTSGGVQSPFCLSQPRSMGSLEGSMVAASGSETEVCLGYQLAPGLTSSTTEVGVARAHFTDGEVKAPRG